jgi:HlyD family secretion protein
MKKLITILVLLAAAGGAVYWYWQTNVNLPTTFRTVTVERGPLEVKINATGTLEPEDVVDIGAQVTGRIEKFGQDPRYTVPPEFGASILGVVASPMGQGPLLAAAANYPGRTPSADKVVDYCAEVEAGTILAKIDDSLYRADMESAKAQLGQAIATVHQNEAQLEQMRSKLVQTTRDWNRAQKLKLIPGGIADVDYDTALNNWETAKYAIDVGVANVEAAKRAVDTTQAALKKAETNLGYCTIRSPVKGVIVDRRVNIGQTVVSSLTASSLFLIAKDLRRIQVWAQVNEADFGQIKEGQQVRFTVDAYPGAVFKGTVFQKRLNASMTQNVVIYTVVVATDNSDGKLSPYLTANLQFIVSQESSVLKLPNSALRYRPPANLIHPDVRAKYLKALQQKKTDNKTQAKDGERATVWVADGVFVRPVRIRIGGSDGVVTEVLGSDLREGMELVVGEARHDDSGGTTNPFTPQMFGKKSQ